MSTIEDRQLNVAAAKLVKPHTWTCRLCKNTFSYYNTAIDHVRIFHLRTDPNPDVDGG